MPISAINTTKELAVTHQPLLLAEFTFLDGSILRLSTHGLAAAYGGVQYAGQNWIPAILNADLAAIQALSDGGIDVAPSISLKLNDGDRGLWTNWEKAKGFKGAKLKLIFVFWAVGTSDFSPDAITKLVGICGPAQIDQTTLEVTAISKLNLNQVQFPIIRVQKRCPWAFPTTASQRDAGANDPNSWFSMCGYSPDVSGGRGNLDGASAFTSCNRTKEQCKTRGMYTKDSSNRVTGRFGGVQWDPPKSWTGRGYISGKFEEGLNSSNEAKYNDAIPMVYGQGFVEPIITNIVGEPNSTRFEAILCYGEVDDIVKVVVNDVEIPPATDMNHNPRPIEDKLFGWWLINRGTRTGAPNALPGWDSKGDPYGSMCAIAIVVPRKLLDSSSVPRVKALIKGPKLRRYTTDSTWDMAGHPTNLNPAWQFMDLLTWGGWDYSELNIPSFRQTATNSDESINFKNQDGQVTAHSRFMSSLVLRSKKSAAEVLRGLRTANRVLLVDNLFGDGKLSLLQKSTLAKQQPSLIAGSNFATAVASKLPSGSAANGYVAYRFDPSNIIQGSMRVSQRSNADSPNRVAVTYQDFHNNFAQDQVSVVDSEAIERGGDQEVIGSIPLDGVCNFDQAKRVIASWFAEQLRGNPRQTPNGDAGGTLIFDFETTFKAVHLWAGALCQLNWPDLGISNQLVRVQRIQPSTNFETCKLSLSWHSDEWYLDSYGQEDAPRYGDQRRNAEQRPPYPLYGQVETGSSNPDPIFGAERFFGVRAEVDAGGEMQFRVRAVPPVNSFPPGLRPPFVPVQGNTAATGGNLSGGRTYWAWLVAFNAAGDPSSPSIACRIDVPTGTSTNTISVPNLDWGDGTSTYALFVGLDPYRPLLQVQASGSPSSVSFVGPLDKADAVRPMPDGEFDFLRLKLKRVRNAGVFAAEITGFAANQIIVADARWNSNQWAGYDCTIIGHAVGPTDTPSSSSYRVTSSTSDTLNLNSGYGPTLPTVIADGERYLLVMRTKPSAWTSNTITEPNFDNSLALYDPTSVTGATNASPIVITSQAHGAVTGELVRIDYLGGNTAANGIWTITRIDDDHFSLNSSSGNGAYTSGGTARRLTRGLDEDEAKGKLLRVIGGTGRGAVYKLASNTRTVITLETDWDVAPDATTRFITEEPDWIRSVDSSPVNITQFNPSEVPEYPVDLNGQGQRTLLVMTVPVDGGGTEAFEPACQLRDFYLFNDAGSAGNVDFKSQVNLTIDGTLAIGSDLASRISLLDAARAVAVKAELKQAPTGAALTFKILLGASDWMTLTIPAGSTSISATAPQIAAAAEVGAGLNIRLDITAVGTTYPGGGLSVSLFF